MDKSEGLMKNLDAASKQHEETIVVELGTDRLVRWLGVYAISFLAVVAKIGEFATSELSCYPTATSVDIPTQFVLFASSFCWKNCGSGHVTNTSECASGSHGNVTLSPDPAQLKLFVSLFPYIMLGQAMMFAIPIALWHFHVGAPLMGHLRFMQLLLNEIYEKVKTVPSGRPNDKAYDAESRTLDGSRVWDKLNATYKQHDKGQEIPMEESSLQETESDVDIDRQQGNTKQTRESLRSNVSKIILKAEKRKQFTRMTSVSWSFTGGMLDRHLFSIFCYENFASLYQLPYILSVFLLTKFESSKLGRRPLNQALMELWCHENNFTNTFLVKRYIAKHTVTAFLSISSLFGMTTWFFAGNVYSEITSATTFGCEIPFYEFCVLCSIKRVDDVIVLLVLDLLVTVAVLLLSLYKIHDIRNSVALNKCHFFEDLKRTSNLALEMAETN